MSVSCCDPKKEPAPQQPNQFTLPSRVWYKIAVEVPSLVVPSTIPDGKMYAFPTRIPPGTEAAPNRNQPKSGIAPLLTSAGEWSVWNDGTQPIDVVVFDSRDPSATATYQSPGYTVATQSAPVVAAGPASTTALAANAQRKYAIFTNDSGNADIYLGLGVVATANGGILLQAGSSYEIFSHSMFYGAVNFIGTVGETLLVVEGT